MTNKPELPPMNPTGCREPACIQAEAEAYFSALDAVLGSLREYKENKKFRGMRFIRKPSTIPKARLHRPSWIYRLFSRF